MFNCPNCGAGMRYDISGKMLMCDHCGSTCGVNDHPDQQLMAIQDDYEATVFTCPQCGGRILSTDNAASDFCTYCGANVTLEGRLSNEKKPELIIPFSRTKEECRDSYRKYAGKVWCLPDEYKSEQFLNKFEGIYLPFWVYQFSQTGRGCLKGTRTSGSYTEYCYLNFDVNNHYDWIAYDAASLFDDEISLEINTYSGSQAEAFNPAYLSGFYADIPDVDASVYQKSAEEDANESTFKRIRESHLFGKMTLNRSDNLSAAMNTRSAGYRSALCPVWFVTWRNKDRVAYAAVNGRTGDCAADLPVSISKYLLFSLLFAVPCIFLFLMLPTMMAKTMLTLTLILGMIMMFLYYRTAVKTGGRELHILDKGYMSSRETAVPAILRKSRAKLEKKRRRGLSDIGKTAIIIGIFMASSLILTIPALISSGVRLEGMLIPAALAAVICTLFLVIQGVRLSTALHSPRILADTVILGGCCAGAAIVGIINPVHDYYYYFGAVLVMAGIVAAVLGLVSQYNRFCTHPVPEYYDREEVGKNA